MAKKENWMKKTIDSGTSYDSGTVTIDKGGRPKKLNKRDKKITLNFTEDELNSVKEWCSENDKQVAALARNLLLEHIENNG